MSQRSDEDLAGLMRRANLGDQIAYRHLLERVAILMRSSVRTWLDRNSAVTGDVEDIVQEALLAVHTKRHTWDTTQPLEPWVRAIVRYKFIDHLRRRGRRVFVPIDDVSETLPSEPARSDSAQGDRERLLARLTDRQRYIVEAMTIQGLTAREVGTELDMAEGAVRVALHRALKTIARSAQGDDR